MRITPQQRLADIFEQLDRIKNVATGLPDDDQRRTELSNVIATLLVDERPVPMRVAARLIGLSRGTIRAWARHGVLRVARSRPTMLLDVVSLYLVTRLVNELRADPTPGRAYAVANQLESLALLQDDDFQESLEQARRGELYLLRSRPPEAGGGQEYEWVAVDDHTVWEGLRDPRTREPDAVEAYEAAHHAAAEQALTTTDWTSAAVGDDPDPSHNPMRSSTYANDQQADQTPEQDPDYTRNDQGEPDQVDPHTPS